MIGSSNIKMKSMTPDPCSRIAAGTSCVQKNVPPIELFQWLIKNYQKAEHCLAFSNIHGLRFSEFQKLTGYEIPQNFDMGWDAHYGADELNDALAKIYNCSVGNIVTSSGGSEANFLVYLSLLEPGDDFIIEKPGYQPMWLSAEMLGARRIDWSRKFEDNYQLDLESLKNLITPKTKLIVLTNPHNPTGKTVPKKDIAELAEIACKNGAYVMIDEIFLEGTKKPQGSSFGAPNVIITSSMTKVFGLGGNRTGWVIGPEEVALKCQLAKAHTDVASNFLGELMSASALEKARAVLVDRFKERTLPNLDIVKEWMARQADILEWVEPNGGIMCYPGYKGNLPSKELCQRLLDEAGVLVNPGCYFNDEGHFRLTFSIEQDRLRSGLDALEGGLRNILG